MFPCQFTLTKGASFPGNGQKIALMTHKYRGLIVALFDKSVEPNKEQKEMRSSFQ